jgi:anti-sigma-K factor RskA
MIDETKIMQYADGTLPIEEKEEVEKAIQDNPEYKKLLKDYQETGDLLFKLGTEIKSQPLPNSLKKKLKEINSWRESYAKKDRPGFFKAIFQKPIRNFIAYPVAAVFIFTLGFQVNMFQVRISTGELKTAKQIEQLGEQMLSQNKQEEFKKVRSTLKKEVATKVEQEAAAEAEKRARSIIAESAIISATKVLRKELEKQKKQIETLQAEIIDLRIKLREATTYYYK